MNSVYLEVDSSIKENQLKLSNEEVDDFEKFLAKNENYPSKYVTPFPGLCVKSKDSLGDKVFVNLCHSELIPEPPNDFVLLSAEEVLEKDVSEFRVPMSIGQVRQDIDLKGSECRVCDVLINSKFFKKVENNTGWKNFLLTIIFESIKEKYEVDCVDQSKIILQNRRHMGTLQKHRIQDREMARKIGINELPKFDNNDKSKIEMLSSTKFDAKCPEYRLYKCKDGQTCLVGEFKFPEVISVDELKLDVGEDRIIIESEERNYLLDIFVPVVLRPESSHCVFDKATKVLTATMPIVGG